MHFDITTKSIRDFADRVTKAHPDINKPRALEIASHGFGHRNFDTLSGMLKDSKAKAKPALPAVKLDKPVSLWIEGFVCENEVVIFEWLKVELTTDFMTNVLKRRDLCVDQKLLHVSEDCAPADWSKDEDLPVIHDWQLYVSPTRFWFRGHPKHCSFAVESRAVHFEELMKLLDPRTEGDKSFRWIDSELYKASRDAESLYETIQDQYEDWEEPSDNDEALQRLEEAEVRLAGNGFVDESAELVEEIARLKDWLQENGHAPTA